MARIDQRLLAKIAEKKGINTKSVYQQIDKIKRDTYLERDLAALVLATRLHISIEKYSTAEQRQQLRSHLSGAPAIHSPAPAPISPAPTGPASRRGVRNGRSVRPKPKDNSVFVIHGRDLQLRDSMFNFLSALGCKPVEFHQAVASISGTGNPFIGVVLDKVFEKMQALVVIFSPDEEAKLMDHFVRPAEKNLEGVLRGQARPNVIFEAGMAMARHQEKTIMVQVGAIKSFSDIAGRHMVHLDNSFESRNDFAGRLANMCTVDRSGSRWTTVGNFTPAGGSSPASASKKKKKKIKKKK